MEAVIKMLPQEGFLLTSGLDLGCEIAWLLDNLTLIVSCLPSTSLLRGKVRHRAAQLVILREPSCQGAQGPRCRGQVGHLISGDCHALLTQKRSRSFPLAMQVDLCRQVR